MRRSTCLRIAFERWGEGTLPRLRGSFALAAWNGAAKGGLLAVDQLGAGPLFVHESYGRLAFATEIRNLVRLLPAHPGPDAEGVVLWVTAGCLRRGRTLLEGVRRLEGGQFVRLSDSGWNLASYWSPRYGPPLKLGEEELAASLRSHLERAVQQRMAVSGKTGGTTGVLLSGGFDSSTVASLARRVEPVGATTCAYSFVFPGHSEADESALIEEVASVLGISSQRTPIGGASSLRSALEFQCAWELPSASPTLFLNLPLLRRAARDGVGVMLDGEGGDELFGCSPYLIADCIRRGNLRRAVALAQRLPDIGATPLEPPVVADARVRPEGRGAAHSAPGCTEAASAPVRAGLAEAGEREALRRLQGRVGLEARFRPAVVGLPLLPPHNLAGARRGARLPAPPCRVRGSRESASVARRPRPDRVRPPPTA